MGLLAYIYRKNLKNLASGGRRASSLNGSVLLSASGLVSKKKKKVSGVWGLVSRGFLMRRWDFDLHHLFHPPIFFVFLGFLRVFGVIFFFSGNFLYM